MSLFFADSGGGQATAPNIFAGNAAALASGVFFGLYILMLTHPKIVRSRESGVRSRESAVEAETRPVGSVPSDESASSPTYKGEVAAASADGVVLSPGEGPQSPIPNPQSKNPAISVFYGNLIIVAVMLPFVTNSFVGGQTVRSNDILAIAYLGIFQIGIAYILFTKGITKGVRSMDASLIGFIEPLLNPVWVFLFVGEKPSNWALLGGTIIIATIVVHTLNQYRNRPSPAAAHRGAKPKS